MRPTALVPLLLLPLVGCGEVPELQAADSDYVRQADYPALVPLEDIGITAETEETKDQASGLDARARALRYRALQLQGNVIDEAERQRLEQGVIEG